MHLRYILLLLALPGPAAAEYNAGMAALERHDGPTALRELKPLALAGEADAENALGLVLERGEGLPADRAEAAAWFRRASNHGLFAGMINLARLLSGGIGVPKDQAEAVRLYLMAANRGSPHAMFLLGVAYERGMGPAADPVSAREWYLKSAQAGLPPGMFEAARLSLATADPAVQAQGRDWLEKAAGTGYTRALGLLGISKLTGLGSFAADPILGARLTRAAADKGDADAAVALGAAYHGGIGVPASEAESFLWTERGAQLGSVQGQVQTARNRLSVRDPAAAFFWGSVAARFAPLALKSGVDAVLADAARQITPAEQAAQRQRALAWRPGLPG